VKTRNNEPDYEPLRVWALQPSSVRPLGVAQCLCGGLITWLQMTPGQTPIQSREGALLPMTQGGGGPLCSLIATMIAEVLT
jgi:hypothetical protein